MGKSVYILTAFSLYVLGIMKIYDKSYVWALCLISLGAFYLWRAFIKHKDSTKGPIDTDIKDIKRQLETSLQMYRNNVRSFGFIEILAWPLIIFIATYNVHLAIAFSVFTIYIGYKLMINYKAVKLIENGLYKNKD